MTLPKHADLTLEMTRGVERGTPRKVLIQDYPRSDYLRRSVKNATMRALHWNDQVLAPASEEISKWGDSGAFCSASSMFLEGQA